MGLPLEARELSGLDFAFFGYLCWSDTVKRHMRAVRIIIPTEVHQLPFQIRGIPEQQLVEQLATNGPDQPFDERM